MGNREPWRREGRTETSRAGRVPALDGTARPRGRGRPAVPLPVLLGARRLPRRQRLLHPFGLPDHEPAADPAARAGARTAADVLDAARPPAAARLARNAVRRHGVRRDRRDARPAAGAARRRVRRPRLRRQLALLPERPELRRPVPRAVAGAALLVARDRRAVLRRVPPRGCRDVVADASEVGAPPAPGARRAARRRHRRVGVARAACCTRATARRASTTAPTPAPPSCSSARSSRSSSPAASRRRARSSRRGRMLANVAGVARARADGVVVVDRAHRPPAGSTAAASRCTRCARRRSSAPRASTGRSHARCRGGRSPRSASISYGVYLYHWPIFLWLTPDRTGLAPAPLFAVRVAITLALAVASFVLLERPVLTGRFPPRCHRRRFVPALVTIPATVAAARRRPAARHGVAARAQHRVRVRERAPERAARRRAARHGVDPRARQAAHAAATDTAAPSDHAPSAAAGVGRRRLRRPDARARARAVGHADRPRRRRERRDPDVRARPHPRVPGAARWCRHAVRRAAPDWAEKWPQTIASFDPDVVIVQYAVWEVEPRKLPDGRLARPGDPAIDRWQLSEYQAAADILSTRGAPVAVGRQRVRGPAAPARASPTGSSTTGRSPRSRAHGRPCTCST